MKANKKAIIEFRAINKGGHSCIKQDTLNGDSMPHFCNSNWVLDQAAVIEFAKKRHGDNLVNVFFNVEHN